MKDRKLKTLLLSTAALLAVTATAISTAPVIAGKAAAPVAGSADTLTTKTPIKHLVVVFQENRSFDHYFGTYPNALNVTANRLSNPPRTPKPTTTSVVVAGVA